MILDFANPILGIIDGQIIAHRQAVNLSLGYIFRPMERSIKSYADLKFLPILSICLIIKHRNKKFYKLAILPKVKIDRFLTLWWIFMKSVFVGYRFRDGHRCTSVYSILNDRLPTLSKWQINWIQLYGLIVKYQGFIGEIFLDSLFVKTVGCLTLKDINLAVSNRVHGMTHNRSQYRGGHVHSQP